MTSTMSPQVRMANDIAVQFQHLPVDQAAKSIANHIRMFWDPRMQAELQRLSKEAPSSFDPLALEAARLLAS
jgi:formate dehydrogenase subunit delta